MIHRPVTPEEVGSNPITTAITQGRVLKEKDIENAILDYLKLQGFYFFKVNNTGVFDPKRKVFRKKHRHDIAGKSDIMGVVNGRFVAIEVKEPNKKKNTSQAQRDFLSNINYHGGFGFVATSISEVVNEFKGQGWL